MSKLVARAFRAEKDALKRDPDEYEFVDSVKPPGKSTSKAQPVASVGEAIALEVPLEEKEELRQEEEGGEGDKEDERIATKDNKESKETLEIAPRANDSVQTTSVEVNSLQKQLVKEEPPLTPIPVVEPVPMLVTEKAASPRPVLETASPSSNTAMQHPLSQQS